ncbi:MAG TPA: HEPN domain-containing protein [Gemmatimonadaceae bacterium]|nr:HEPN domain-containing protein [Gemmatimonadaceae bacterium]
MIRPSPLADPVLADITRTIVERCRPRRVVLYGSRARGDEHAESDYDLMVEVDGRRPERLEPALNSVMDDHDWDADVWVVTPARFVEERTDVGLLAYQIAREGIVLYADEGVSRELTPPPAVRERPPGPPRSLSLWLCRAENDYATAHHMLRRDPPITDAVVFHAHQSAEKFLKAVIVSQWRPVRKTHRLGKLLDLCPADLMLDPDVRHACAVLLCGYRKSRYPLWEEPSDDDANSAAAAATVVRAAALRVLES